MGFRKPLSRQDPDFKAIVLLHDPILLKRSFLYSSVTNPNLPMDT